MAAVIPQSTAPLQLDQHCLAVMNSATFGVCSPTKDHDREELAGRKLDEEVRNDGLPNQLRYVYDGSEPTVLIVDQVRVLDQTEDRGVAQGGFVE